MSESSESSTIMNAPERNIDDESETLRVTQEEVDEKIRSHLAPLTKQLEDLTRWFRGWRPLNILLFTLAQVPAVVLAQPGIGLTYKHYLAPLNGVNKFTAIFIT